MFNLFDEILHFFQDWEETYIKQGQRKTDSIICSLYIFVIKKQTNQLWLKFYWPTTVDRCKPYIEI